MDFGKLPDITGIDHILPPDAPENAAVLPGRPHPNPGIYIGCPSWNHPEWMGKVYAQGKKSREFLPEYTRQFNAIEVNATAYNLPTEAKIASWAAAATPGFKFSIKFPQSLTHYGSPAGKEGLVDTFLERVAPLGDHLGPPILQLPDRFGPKWGSALHDLLRYYRGPQPLALELRHEDWFVGEGRAWFDWLAQLGHIAISTDTSGRRDVCHTRLTTPRALIRFNGNNRHPTDYARLDAWAERIAAWLAQGLEEVYFFVHTLPKEFCPELCAYFTQALGQRIGRPLPTWQPVATEPVVVATPPAATSRTRKPKG